MLTNRRKIFKITDEGKIKKWSFKEKKEVKDEWQVVSYMGVGFYLVTPIIGGLIIGLLTKKILFFIFLGMIFSFYNLFKLTKS